VLADGHAVIEPGDTGVWFLFQDRPYDIARVYRSGVEFRGYYVDMLEPVRWSGSDPGTLEPITDLFLDLWIWPDLRHAVLDEDELHQAETRGGVSPDQAASARATAAELISGIAKGQFPPPVVRNYELPPPVTST